VNPDRYDITPGRRSELLDRLLLRCDYDEVRGCLLWGGYTHPRAPYGRLTVDGTHYRTHRLAWALLGGPPAGDLNTLHTCDEPRCVNPAHLYLGTQKDNVRDMVVRGRQNCPTGDRSSSRRHPDSRPRGEAQGSSKLTDAQVVEIRSRYAAGGVSTRALGREFSVHPTTIFHVVKGDAWSHVPPAPSDPGAPPLSRLPATAPPAAN
jgi:hypothetical protein